jgi:carboxyl-terminal processing protease
MRRPVDVESIVDVKMIDPQQGIGYLKMTGFQKTTNRELKSALDQLNAKSMKMLILDLRGNPGGLLNCSVEIADQFLSKGVIVTTRGRSDGQSQVYQAKPEVEWNFPLVILVDRDSASASEILAGALQENGRAEVMGERSFGKGSVQSIFPMVSVSAGLKLTTARFYSPLDRPYTQGVTPNIITRQVAKPNSEGATGAGNNVEDYVLRSALEHARTKLGNVAGGTNRTIGATNSGSANELR